MVERVYHFGRVERNRHFCELLFVCPVCRQLGSFADFAGPARGAGFGQYGEGTRPYRPVENWHGRLRIVA